jgi:hypothetical protein
MKIRREEKRGRQKQKVGNTVIKRDTTNKESASVNERKEGR